MTKLALWWLKRNDYVCLAAGEFTVALKVMEAADDKIKRLYGIKRRGRPSFIPQPVAESAAAFRSVMRILRHCVPPRGPA
jgi:hypothetical protein